MSDGDPLPIYETPATPLPPVPPAADMKSHFLVIYLLHMFIIHYLATYIACSALWYTYNILASFSADYCIAHLYRHSLLHEMELGLYVNKTIQDFYLQVQHIIFKSK